MKQLVDENPGKLRAGAIEHDMAAPQKSAGVGGAVPVGPVTGATLRFIILVMAMTIVAGYGAARRATRQAVLEGLRVE